LRLPKSEGASNSWAFFKSEAAIFLPESGSDEGSSGSLLILLP